MSLLMVGTLVHWNAIKKATSCSALRLTLVGQKISDSHGAPGVYMPQKLRFDLHVRWLALRLYSVKILLETNGKRVQLLVGLFDPVVDPKQPGIVREIFLIEDRNVVMLARAFCTLIAHNLAF
jgi:hypothetical protein